MKFEHYHFDEVESTQIEAKKKLNESAKVPFLITADMQTKGIATKGKSWAGERGNLFATFVFQSDKDFDFLPLTSAKIMKDVVFDEFDVALELKAPNDLLFNGKKCCGILLEKITFHEKLCFLIGIGFNCFKAPFLKDVKATFISCDPNTLINNWVKRALKIINA